jgi:hypothetical protein
VALAPAPLPLHELQRRNDQVRDAVTPGGLELQRHLSGGVGLYALVGQRRAGDVAAQLFQSVALVCFAAHRQVQAETIDVGAQRLARCGVAGPAALRVSALCLAHNSARQG